MAAAATVKEQKPRTGGGSDLCRGFCLEQLTPDSCEVEAMAELMTVRLPELVNAKIDRCPHWKRKKATSLVALIEQAANDVTVAFEGDQNLSSSDAGGLNHELTLAVG
jgi:hypothetical protein